MLESPDRRAFLMAGAALALAGCVPATAGPAVPSVDRSIPAATGAPGKAPRASASDSLRQRSTRAPEPTALTRGQVIAGFSGRTPSYWGLEAPQVLTTLPAGSVGTALTLDFCGGPGGSSIDGALIDMLRRFRVPATLLLNGRWITANPDLARDLAADPLFELANYGTNHYPLSVSGASAYGIFGTEGPGSVFDEIMANDAVLTDLAGKRPRFFRPGTAYLDDVAAEICLALNLIPAGFSINGDGGSTYTAASVAAEAAAAGPGDIIIAHCNHPESGTGPGLAEAVAHRHRPRAGPRPVPLPPHHSARHHGFSCLLWVVPAQRHRSAGTGMVGRPATHQPGSAPRGPATRRSHCLGRR
ncbi:peptidoglycan/xylan/chitin deacetylase (PgdA/CDA1 family) [Arthrobacter sp. CAN_C5]|nr:peptidoglycan/xylan/chitin deacetylase (PgdA/CDA1 family) [Arthrobacter sp. CAN_C5]